MNDISKQLSKAGYEPAGDGSVALSGAAATLYRRLERFLALSLARYYQESTLAPIFIEEDVLERAGYLAHFPQQVFVAQGIVGARHATPLPGRKYLNPAGCLHVYPTLRGRDLA